MTNATDAEPIRLIYIAGDGRSGSTLLASILGCHAGVVSVGELSQLHRCGWRLGEYCSCGETGVDCPFWNAVRQQWRSRSSETDINRYEQLQQAFERLRAWPRLALQSARVSPTFQDYLKHSSALLESICAASGCRIIVDSSKNALRAEALSHLPHVDVRLIHLVRDVRAVAWSHAKPYRRDLKSGVPRDMSPRPVWNSAVRWVMANLIAERVCRRMHRSMLRVRYEDLVGSPLVELDRIGRSAGLELRPLAQHLLDGGELPIHHQIAGNRMRMKGRLHLSADWEWIARLSPSDRRVCWWIAGWLAERYGYSREAPIIAAIPPAHGKSLERSFPTAQPEHQVA